MLPHFSTDGHRQIAGFYRGFGLCMSIKVRYFAGLRDQLGRDQEDLDASGVATVADVWTQVAKAEFPANTLVAINQEYAKPGDAVADGDEVAFFPPVTGG